jgi:hypothetical protein
VLERSKEEEAGVEVKRQTLVKRRDSMNEYDLRSCRDDAARPTHSSHSCALVKALQRLVIEKESTLKKPCMSDRQLGDRYDED